MDVSLVDIFENSMINFTEDEGISIKYESPLNIKNSIKLTAFDRKKGVQSLSEEAEFIKYPKDEK